MRYAIAIVLLNVCAFSQTTEQPTEDLQAIATEVGQSLYANPGKRGIKPYTMPALRLVVIDKAEFNAHAQTSTQMIYLGAPLVHILKNDRGELAFVIAHELGHIQDSDCHEHGLIQGIRGTALQRMCENNADMIGLQYLMAAGYSPFDAAGAMGKLMLLSGSDTTITGIFLGRFLSDHPVDVDRIRHIGEGVRAICGERPELCR
jgi:Zn-dependent protease with chaperone function